MKKPDDLYQFDNYSCILQIYYVLDVLIFEVLQSAAQRFNHLYLKVHFMCKIQHFNVFVSVKRFL